MNAYLYIQHCSINCKCTQEIHYKDTSLRAILIVVSSIYLESNTFDSSKTRVNKHCILRTVSRIADVNTSVYK